MSTLNARPRLRPSGHLRDLLVRWDEQKQIILEALDRGVLVADIAHVLGVSEGFVVRACQPD